MQAVAVKAQVSRRRLVSAPCEASGDSRWLKLALGLCMYPRRIMMQQWAALVVARPLGARLTPWI